MRRLTYVTVATAALALAAYFFWHFDMHGASANESPWLLFGPVGASLLVSIVFLVMGCSDNIYHIKQGRVVDHRFTPEHYVPTRTTYIQGANNTMTPIIQPGHTVAADWELVLENQEGHTGSLHFDGPDIFDSYPVGSYYMHS